MPSPLASDDAVQQIKARVDLVELVQQHVRLRKQGREFSGLCPFHQEKTPSFSVNQQLQSWFCHGCQRGGDQFTFVELIEKTDFKGALQILAEQAGIELVQESPEVRRRTALRRRVLEMNQLAIQYYQFVLHDLPAGEPGRKLLAERGVGEETARRFGLGYAPGADNFAQFLRKRGRPMADAFEASLVRRNGQDYFEDRLLIPIRDERGQPVAFTGRTVKPDEPRKYINSPETPAYTKGRVLFALDLAREAIEQTGHAVLMEGQFDVISAHQHGITNAVASSGTAFTEEQVRLLKRFTDEVVLVFDSDRSGTQAAFKAIELCSNQQLRSRVGRVTGEAKDPDEFLRAAGAGAAAAWDQLLRSAQTGWAFWIRQSIEGLNPRSPADLEVALGRVNGILEKIADPALRDTYRQEAANWLQIDSKLMAQRPGPRPSRLPVEAGESGRSPGLPARSGGKTLSVGVSYLLQFLAVHPDASARVRDQLPPEELDDEDRVAYLRMLETLDRGGLEALSAAISTFPDEEQVLVRKAWASPPPGDVDDAVRRIRQRAIQNRHRALRSELADAERRGDRERVGLLEAEIRELGKNL